MEKLVKKRMILLTLALLLLAGFFAPVRGARAVTVIASGTVNSTTLNMRPDPSTHGAIVATLKYGDAVNVTETCGNWLGVEVPSLGKSGYVSGKYIALSAGSGIYGFGVTNIDAHLRTENTAESASKAVLNSKAGLILIQMESNGWWRVKVPSEGLEGYIARKCVNVVCKAAKSASGSTAQETTGTITGNGVNLRSGASTGSKSLGLLTKGTKVTVLNTSGDWVQVKITSSGKTGYVFKTFVKTTGASSSGSSSSSGTAAVITASGVNLRESASTSSKSLGMLRKNTAVTVSATSGDWCKIKVISTGAAGYVAKKFVKINASSDAQITGAAGYVNASDVSLRESTSTASTRLGRMAKNTAVSVLGDTGKWYRVSVASLNKTGYISKTYVTMGAVPTATPTPAATAMPATTATPTPAATATPAPTATPASAATATPAPTATPTPAPTATPVPTANPAV